MTPKFLYALSWVLRHEGGYSNHPEDLGGETRWGISERAFGKIETFDQAVEIYWREFWQHSRLKLEHVEPPEIAAKVLDVAVNFGQAVGAKIVQRAIGATDDGSIGPKTRTKLRARDAERTLALIAAEQAAAYRKIGKPAFLAGWLWRAYDQPPKA